MPSSLVKRPKELIIIDGNIGDTESILSNLKENQSYIILSDGNGFAPLLEYLEISGTEWSAFHFITHGSDAAFTLNGTTVSGNNLCSEEWLNIGKYLTDDGDILFYGCNIPASDEGKTLMNTIAGLTGADTAASVDTTGFGGNNILEYFSGTIETASVLPETFSQSLELIQNQLTIATDADPTYENATFSAPSCTSDGGAVYNGGTFTANSCTFSGNMAGILSKGGAISQSGSQSLVVIRNSSFLTASDTIYIEGGSATFGGKIFLAGNLYSKNALWILNTIFSCILLNLF